MFWEFYLIKTFSSWSQSKWNYTHAFISGNDHICEFFCVGWWHVFWYTCILRKDKTITVSELFCTCIRRNRTNHTRDVKAYRTRDKKATRDLAQLFPRVYGQVLWEIRLARCWRKLASRGAEGDINEDNFNNFSSKCDHTHKETAERTVWWGILHSSFLVSAPAVLSCPFHSSKRQTSNHMFLLCIKPWTFSYTNLPLL